MVTVQWCQNVQRRKGRLFKDSDVNPSVYQRALLGVLPYQ